ncbi:MAG: FAD-dependent oxidoreductase [Candidatus Roizmanbacteria bacterium]
MSSTLHNIVIIGGGPAGLSSAIYLARAGLKPLVFAGSPPGGQLMLTTEVENFPGIPKKMGPDLIAGMRAQAESFGAQILDINVTSIAHDIGSIQIDTEAEDALAHVSARSLLIATGAKALWLGLPNETRLRGRGVSACATCDGFFFRNKTIAVIGGGDTAVEEALHLTKYASKVILVHRRDVLRASKIMQDRLAGNPTIKLLLNAQIIDILGDQKVSGLKVQISDEKKPKEIPLEGIFIAIGHKPDTGLCEGILDLDAKGYIMTNARLAEYMLIHGTDEKYSKRIKSIQEQSHYFASHTNKVGIFAAGDCVDSAYRQAATASGMGVGASLDIEKYLEQ